jgi:hypothetical protein
LDLLRSFDSVFHVIFTYTGIFWSHKEEWNFSHWQVNGQNWRTSSWVKLARFRRPKAICFLSSVEYRLNTNANNIIKNRSC